MKNDLAIRATGLGKSYRLAHAAGSYRTLQEDVLSLPQRLWRSLRRPESHETAWVLRDVSFEVRRGEVLGLIGRNGAGKSTLLKILSRITEPTTGQAQLYGRVGSLLEVGSGFHPELTGRENIFLSGAILGMSRAEIARHFDEIVAFADVERFLDTAAKHFSSGMYMRLAFAVAAHLQTEILLLDEVLAVGDAEFQKKCLGVVEGIAGSGRTVLFVSHNLGAVESLCSRTIVLDRGQIAGDGPSAQMVARYLQTAAAHEPAPLSERRDRKGDGRLRFVRFEVIAKEALPRTGQGVTLRLHYQLEAPLTNLSFAVGLTGPGGSYELVFSSEETGRNLARLERSGFVDCQIAALPLSGGSFGVNLYCAANGVLADNVINAAALVVDDGEFYRGGARHPEHPLTVAAHEWSSG